MKLQLPLTKDNVEQLEIGDVLELNGYVYTARDAAHKRMVEALQKGERIPIDLENQTIFYTGPCPARPGNVVGPIGPTTSVRMDPYVETLLKQGMVAMIGKGDRSDYIPALLKKYKAVYLLGIGGASAVGASHVKEVEVIAYDDLGTESIKKLYLENYKVIVGIDSNGQVIQTQEIAKYKKTGQ